MGGAHPDVSETTKVTYAHALGEAIRMEMHRDPDVVCVAAGREALSSPVTGPLARAFGPDRILELDTQVRPVAVAAGLAAQGLHVVCEAPAPRLGPDALSALAELDGEIRGSLVVRVPAGGPQPAGRPVAPVESRLFDTPGIAVLAPSTPADAKGLLAAAIRRGGVTCVVEAEPLYGVVDDVPEGSLLIEPGSASVTRVREPALAVIAYGEGVRLTHEALALAGVAADVCDLRSLRPLDADALVGCAARAGRIAVVEPDSATRLSAEVAALLLRDAFAELRGPLVRLELGDERTLAERFAQLV